MLDLKVGYLYYFIARLYLSYEVFFIFHGCFILTVHEKAYSAQSSQTALRG